ncbi:MAG: macro domain-containing protein [Clostridia bacterium]|nr:macro domain-containing protein [Clostridia bacterium]
MPLFIVRNDITKMKVDAVVNAANEQLIGGGGVDGAIHRAAGPELLRACQKLGGCRPGCTKVTEGFRMPCKYIIHTVGPVWNGGEEGEEAILRSCYRSSLEEAEKHGCSSVAFPLISSGIFGYPKDQALRVAVSEITDFLRTGEKTEITVYIAVFDRASFNIGKELYAELESFISANITSEVDDEYVNRNCMKNIRRLSLGKGKNKNVSPDASLSEPIALSECCFAGKDASPTPKSLLEAVNTADESFQEMLLRKIDERGMKDSECYKKANVDRKLFSKIRKDKYYKPSKATVIAFAVALELSLEETREMLMKAGFALSRSQKFDIIVEFFIGRGNYNVHEINEALFAFDQVLLGA